ncbi:hypothetical protein ACOMHN_037734 [Nucella lapillus]
MATSGDQSIEQEYEDLTHRQKLRAAMHYSSLKLCQDAEDKYAMTVDQQVVAAITETVWRQVESFAVDLELFAKHARRSVISPDDVKLLVRRNPCLLKHIQEVHEELTKGREESASHRQKKTTKKVAPPPQTVTSEREMEQS